VLEAPAESTLEVPRALLAALEFPTLLFTLTPSTLLGLGAHGQ